MKFLDYIHTYKKKKKHQENKQPNQSWVDYLKEGDSESLFLL